jgi:hypothetical protein
MKQIMFMDRYFLDIRIRLNMSTVICPYLGKGGKQDFVLSLRFGILHFYGSMLGPVALSFSTCLPVGHSGVLAEDVW